MHVVSAPGEIFDNGVDDASASHGEKSLHVLPYEHQGFFRLHEPHVMPLQRVPRVVEPAGTARAESLTRKAPEHDVGTGNVIRVNLRYVAADDLRRAPPPVRSACIGFEVVRPDGSETGSFKAHVKQKQPVFMIYGILYMQAVDTRHEKVSCNFLKSVFPYEKKRPVFMIYGILYMQAVNTRRRKSPVI